MYLQSPFTVSFPVEVLQGSNSYPFLEVSGTPHQRELEDTHFLSKTSTPKQRQLDENTQNKVS